MAQRTAKMALCETQPGDSSMDSRWNVEFFDEDGALVRTIPFVTSMEAHRRVKSWEGTLDG